jgi:epoxide hydrolase-like predicted phosphatase
MASPPRPGAGAERPEALLVDYGGVLTTPVTVSFAEFCLRTGISPERFRTVLASAYVDRQEHGRSAEAAERRGTERRGTERAEAEDGLVAAFETGRISTEEFDRRLAEELSKDLPAPIEAEGLSARMLAGLRPDPRMVAAVAAARAAGLRTALVSNTWGGVAFDPDTLSLFDAVVLSASEGLRKPGPEIFLVAAERLGVDPRRCVFVDDIPANVRGAEAVGMTGVLHRDAAITVPRLEELLGIRLSR